MEQPEGFQQGGDDEDLVCMLDKSLYGLKQSARVWNRKLRDYLISIGFIQLHSDNCIFYHPKTGVIIAVWVDDLVLFEKGMEGINRLKKELNTEFEMKDSGELKYFLGIQVLRNRKEKRIQLAQSGYTRQILERFDMESSKPMSTPLATGTKLIKATDSKHSTSTTTKA